VVAALGRRGTAISSKELGLLHKVWFLCTVFQQYDYLGSQVAGLNRDS